MKLVETEHRAALNRWWATWMLEELHRQGVKHVCLAPGSRSTPLTLAAAENPNLTIHTHFDERGLGFLALGLAKATQTPVAIIVTSGTAVANLLPAIAESGLTKEPLVVLTSDRPAELIACGANQAIVQHNIFSSHVTAFYDLPSPTFSISPTWLLTTVDEAMAKQAQLGGAVHFNCHYPEPLYGEKTPLSDYSQAIEAWWQGHQPYCEFTELSSTQPAVDFSSFVGKKGILLIGRLPQNARASVNAFAEKLGWPMLADVQSGLAGELGGFDAWLQNPECLERMNEAQVVIQLGARFVSKRLGQWLERHVCDAYWLVSPQVERLDPWHKPSRRICCDIQRWCEAALKALPETRSVWQPKLAVAAQKYQDHLDAQFTALSELSLAHQLGKHLLPQSQLFMGNSLMVRLLDMCGTLPEGKRWTNRGASGIDGLIATFAGVARTTLDPMVMVLGDTSFLYDLNSLALLRQHRQPLVVIVTNNDGGGIFDMLPVPTQQKDDFYRLPHGLNFKAAADLFGLHYVLPKTLDEALRAIEEGQQTSYTTVIEIVTPAGEAGEHMKTLFDWVKHAALLS